MPRRATSARRPSPPRREMRVARAFQPPLCRAPLASVCARACAERRPVRLCYALTCGPKRRAQQPARLPTMEELGQGEGKEERPPSLRHPQEERPSSLHPLPRRQRRRQQGQGGRLLHCWGPLPHRYQRPRPRSSKNARRERRRRRSLPCLPECGGRKCVHVHMSHVPMKRRQSRRTRPSSSLLESGAVPSKTQHRRLTHERECPRPHTHKRAHTHTHTHTHAHTRLAVASSLLTCACVHDATMSILKRLIISLLLPVFSIIICITIANAGTEGRGKGRARKLQELDCLPTRLLRARRACFPGVAPLRLCPPHHCERRGLCPSLDLIIIAPPPSQRSLCRV